MFRSSGRREQMLDELVISILTPVFPPSETYPCDEVAALAHCGVMETPGWSNITTQEIRASIGRIYSEWVILAGKMNQPVHWDVTDVLRHLCPYKAKYPDLLRSIYWQGIC